MTQKLLNVSDVAQLLGISKSLVYEYARAKIIVPLVLPLARESTATKRNRRAIRFRAVDIDSFISKLAT